jgi:hypothetical protein
MRVLAGVPPCAFASGIVKAQLVLRIIVPLLHWPGHLLQEIHHIPLEKPIMPYDAQYSAWRTL